MHDPRKTPLSLHVVLFVCVLSVLSYVGIVVHELGHGLTAEVLGGDFTALTIWPGFELWPNFGEKRPHMQGYFGGAGIGSAGLSDTERNVVRLMGSGATMAVSLLATILLWALRPKRYIGRCVLVSLSLYFMDILTYTFCPQLGMPRFILIGRTTSHAEPLAAATALGFPKPAFNILVAVASVSILLAVVRLARRPKEP